MSGIESTVGRRPLERLPQFVYYLWYPGVLGSMLYDVLQGPGDNHPVYAARLLVAFVYSVDYVHLFHDLPDTTRKLGPQAPILDGVIALGFGLAASSLEREPAFSCLLLVALSIPFVMYYWSRPRHLRWVVALLVSVIATLLLVLIATSSPLSAFLCAIGVFAAFYASYCFLFYPRLTAGEQ